MISHTGYTHELVLDLKTAFESLPVEKGKVFLNVAVPNQMDICAVFPAVCKQGVTKEQAGSLQYKYPLNIKGNIAKEVLKSDLSVTITEGQFGSSGYGMTGKIATPSA